MNDRWIRIGIGAAVLLALALPAWGQAQPPPEPLTLKRAAELALERAPQLATVRAARDEADATASLARDAFHPFAAVTTTPGYTYGLPGLVVGRVPSIVGVEVRQAIYDPTRRSDALQAEATASGLQATVERSCQETVQKAVIAYARCWVDQSLVDTARRRLDSADAVRRRVEALAAEGRRTDLDAERARLEAARAKQKLLNAESDRDLDLLELKRLIGWPGSAAVVLAGSPDGALPVLGSTENLDVARNADPELKSLGREIALLGQSASLLSKRWAPVIEASAQYNRLGKFNDYDKYYVTFTPDSVAIGVSIGLPLWTGGRFDDGARRARARLDQAEAQRVAREQELELSVRRAEAAVARSTAEQSLSRRSLGIEEQAFVASRELVREGRRDLSDLEEREMALADADESTARSGLDSLLERVKLLALRGELSQSLLGADPPCAIDRR